MYIGINIKNIFWPFAYKKDKCILLLVIELNDAKIVNILIKKNVVLDYILYKCMKYNPTCKSKQCFNYYKYSYILVYY